MKYKNTFLILAYICYITVICANHINQDSEAGKSNHDSKVKKPIKHNDTVKLRLKKVVDSKPKKISTKKTLRAVNSSSSQEAIKLDDSKVIELYAEDTDSDYHTNMGGAYEEIDLANNDNDSNTPESLSEEDLKHYEEYEMLYGPEHMKIDSEEVHSKPSSSCWMSLNAGSLFKTMNDIDNRYADVRKKVQETVAASNFNDNLLKAILNSGGAAMRELYKNQYERNMIPAGLNLGGYCMMRMSDSVLFFHRMKLRNDTRFRINLLENDLSNMVLTARLSLNDLHLRGAFERSVTDRDASTLFYAPTFGELDILLKSVEYKVEGRYRIIKDRLVIEVLITEIFVTDVLLSYVDAKDTLTIRLEQDNIAEFVDRMKTDLDKWLKDFFNDFLIYIELSDLPQIDQLVKYDKMKAIALNEYMDNAMDMIRDRIRERKGSAIKIPKFTIMGVNGFQINLHDGIFRGLDSIYRRSVTTSKLERDIRKVDSIVGFSNLKVTYQYDVKLPIGPPPLSGVLTLSANDLTAHLSLSMVKDPETVDIDINFLDQTKPQSLTMEGSADILIAHFKHLLEHQIIAIMTNTLLHGIKTLRSLPKCEPFLPGQTISKSVANQEYKKYIKKININKQKAIDDSNRIPHSSGTEDDDGLDSTAKRMKKVKKSKRTGNHKQGENRKLKLKSKSRKHSPNKKIKQLQGKPLRGL